MKTEFLPHIISSSSTARDALRSLSTLPDGAVLNLFVTDDNGKLVGTITDGDIRRGLLNNLEISDSVVQYMNKNFKFFVEDSNNSSLHNEYVKLGLELIPVLSKSEELVDFVDLTRTKAALPMAALLMAGGKGERLRPLTANIPKPMLLVGDKPIIEHNIDRLIKYGVKDIYISVKYLKEKIIEYFGDGSSKGIRIHYIEEDKPLGTVGALSLIENFSKKTILLMNSDILTDIDFEDFYNHFVESKARMSVASIPYSVNVPYAVLRTDRTRVSGFEEKPRYTYYSNGGIYLLDAKLKDLVPVNEHFNATDLMESMIGENELVHYPLISYWLDIGKHQDFIKAQEDVKHLFL
jgi:dTDP-glucose pyrophosphorylase